MNNKFLNKINLFLLFSILLLAGAAQQTMAVTRTVTKLADTNDNVCNADCSLREAVAVAQAGDEIKFQPALAGSTITLSTTISIGKSVTITGIDNLAISGGGKVRLFSINNKADVSMKNLDLGHGYQDTMPAPWVGVGGAIAVFGSSLSLDDCYIHNSKASTKGGAIWAVGSLINIKNSLIAANYAQLGGGGIYSTDSNLSISNTRFNINYTPNQGGAMWLSDCHLKMTDTSIYKSSAEIGGALYLTEYNGGVYVIKDSAIHNNGAKTAGGIYNKGILKLINSTLSNNHATMGSGGALSSHNQALLRNVTVTANHATVDAGGIDSVVGDINVGNTIVAGNTSGNQFSANMKGLFNSAGYNLFGPSFSATVVGTQTGNQFNVADPMLNTLTYNGSATMNHLPKAGSPVIDAGNDALAVDEFGFQLSTDQRGLNRISGDAVDIGAVEVSN